MILSTPASGLCIQCKLVCLQQILHELLVLYHAHRLHIILRVQPHGLVSCNGLATLQV